MRLRFLHGIKILKNFFSLAITDFLGRDGKLAFDDDVIYRIPLKIG